MIENDFNTGTVGCVPYYDPALNWIYPQSQRVTKRVTKTTKQYDEKGRVTSEEIVEEITYGSGYYVTNTTSTNWDAEFPRQLRQNSNTTDGQLDYDWNK